MPTPPEPSTGTEPGVAQPRLAARVILVDGRGHVLLFRWDSRAGRRHWWILPGGGVKPGETVEAAALRELAEECGLHGVPLGPEVWRRRHQFEWDGRLIDQSERIFMVRVVAHEVDVRGHEQHETEVMSHWRWWSPDEIAASSETFAPRRLGELLMSLLGGAIPAEPLDVGV